jgi:hypothetical protein
MKESEAEEERWRNQSRSRPPSRRRLPDRAYGTSPQGQPANLATRLAGGSSYGTALICRCAEGATSDLTRDENVPVEPVEGRRNSVVGGLLVLVVRGVLLWIVMPVALVVWPFIRVSQRSARVTFGQYLGWVDLNLIACVQRIATPLLVRHPIAWTSARDMSEITHRLRATDPG